VRGNDVLWLDREHWVAGDDSAERYSTLRRTTF
jgi:hypothetical protein